MKVKKRNMKRHDKKKIARMNKGCNIGSKTQTKKIIKDSIKTERKLKN